MSRRAARVLPRPWLRRIRACAWGLPVGAFALCGTLSVARDPVGGAAVLPALPPRERGRAPALRHRPRRRPLGLPCRLDQDGRVRAGLVTAQAGNDREGPGDEHAAAAPDSDADAPTSCEEGVAASEDHTSVRIVAISDTHGFHLNLDIPDGDILIHCGDAAASHPGRRGSRDGRAVGFPDFVKWFLEQPHKRKYFVEGNHDNSRQARDMLGSNMLRGSLECHGLTLHGLPHSRSERGYTEVPSSVDVLVSHEPPFGVLDKALKKPHGRSHHGRVQHVGSKGLRKTLAKLGTSAPRLHLFGHIHEARGVKESTKGTIFANVANANPGMAKRLHHGCMVFDVAAKGKGEIDVVKMTSDGLKT